MWENILDIVISNGIFATLFVVLFAYVLKDSSKREKKYTDTISSLNRSLTVVEEIEEKVVEVKDDVDKLSTDVKIVKHDVKEIKKIVFPNRKEKEN